MTLDKIDIVNSMVKYGGSFVTALASCIMTADHINLKKIKETWPDLWQQYESIAEIEKERGF